MDKEHCRREFVLGVILNRRLFLTEILEKREIRRARECVLQIKKRVSAGKLQTIGDFHETTETDFMVLEFTGVAKVDGDVDEKVILKEKYHNLKTFQNSRSAHPLLDTLLAALNPRFQRSALSFLFV